MVMQCMRTHGNAVIDFPDPRTNKRQQCHNFFAAWVLVRYVFLHKQRPVADLCVRSHCNERYSALVANNATGFRPSACVGLNAVDLGVVFALFVDNGQHQRTLNVPCVRQDP